MAEKKKNDKTPKKSTSAKAVSPKKKTTSARTSAKAASSKKKTAPARTPAKAVSSKKKTTSARTSAKAVSSKKKTAPARTPTKAVSSKKKTTPAKRSNVKPLKHDDKFERGIDDDKPVIINIKKDKKPTSNTKELRRVAKTGGYTAWDAKAGKTFATKKEADDYAMQVFIDTGKIIDISRTDRQVTHTFKAEQTNRK